MDQDGRIDIDWGVYGVARTFVIDKGVIRANTQDKLTADDVQQFSHYRCWKNLSENDETFIITFTADLFRCCCY